MREAARERRARLIAHLGGKCVRCGFSDSRALQIDHVNGDGHKLWRKPRNASAYFKEVMGDKEGRFQLLCANCNWIKRAENNETALGQIRKK